jgi:hypothetical protein
MLIQEGSLPLSMQARYCLYAIWRRWRLIRYGRQLTRHRRWGFCDGEWNFRNRWRNFPRRRFHRRGRLFSDRRGCHFRSRRLLLRRWLLRRWLLGRRLLRRRLFLRCGWRLLARAGGRRRCLARPLRWRLARSLRRRLVCCWGGASGCGSGRTGLFWEGRGTG